MKRTSVLSFSNSAILIVSTLVFLSTILIPSCTKLDVSVENKIEVQNRFFAIPVNTPQSVYKVADALKKQNGIGGFIPAFAKKEGYAIWNKSIVQEIKNTTILSREGDESFTNETLVFVPIVQQDSNFVNGFFFSRIVDDSVELHLYRANDFDKYSYGPVDELFLTAERVTIQLLKLNDAVFGTRKFRITDDSLFRKGTGPVLHGEMGRTIQLQDSIGFSGRFQQAIICTETPDCWCFRNNNVCGPEHACMQNNCDLCYFCIKVTCTTVTYNGPGGTDDWPPEPPDDNPPSEGGGSGGGSNCTGNNNCGQARTLIAEGKLPCGGCGDGPIIVVPPEDPPEDPPVSDTCQLLLNKGKQLDSLYIKGKVDSMLNTFSGWQNYVNEKGFSVLADCRKISGDTVTQFYFPTDIVNGTDTSIGFNPILTEYSPYHFDLLSSNVHIHPKKAYSTPSPSDIYNNLIANSINEPRFDGIFTVSGHGDTYAMVVTNKAQALTFNNTKSQYLDGIKWKESSAIGQAFKDAVTFFRTEYKAYDTTSRRNLSYQMAMAAVLKQFNTGITLYKKDSFGKFKPVEVKTTTPNPNKPQKKVYTIECPYLINFEE